MSKNGYGSLIDKLMNGIIFWMRLIIFKTKKATQIYFSLLSKYDYWKSISDKYTGLVFGWTNGESGTYLNWKKEKKKITAKRVKNMMYVYIYGRCR